MFEDMALWLFIISFVFFIIRRIYLFPHIKCFFGFHRYNDIPFTQLNSSIETKLTCTRKNCSSMWIRGSTKWFFIRGYRAP